MRKNGGREKVNLQNSPSKLYLGVRVTYERLGLTSRYRPVRLMKKERESESVAVLRHVVARRSRQDGLSVDVNLTRTIHEDTSSRAIVLVRGANLRISRRHLPVLVSKR
ncbi:hypothetical protein DMN91_003892 [Ooceraea biroi]|uniref:Uncharacterized protein n=1 Tax=Ooceraea biroi TaxID=2015173 RepID=A0A3L8DTM5_OOCBI|nr:hypothetical protein DMN91_003892 [Ooceraea biroi]